MKKSFLGAVLVSFMAINVHANDTTIVPKRIVQPDGDNAGLKLSPGFGALAVEDSVGKARHIVATVQGALYVKLDNKLVDGKEFCD
jgi:hypothetical protein